VINEGQAALTERQLNTDPYLQLSTKGHQRGKEGGEGGGGGREEEEDGIPLGGRVQKRGR
jgi:hypothetical protein